MEEKLLFELGSAYRDNMRIKGFTFGQGEKSICIVGATRGNEVQQVYICSQLVRIFTELEQQGRVSADIVRDVGNERKAKFYPGVLDDLHENHSFGYIIRQPEMFVNRG